MQIFKSCYLVKTRFYYDLLSILRLILLYEVMLKHFWYNSTWSYVYIITSIHVKKRVRTCKKWGNTVMYMILWNFIKQMICVKKMNIFMFQTVRFLRISYFGYVLWLLTLNTIFQSNVCVVRTIEFSFNVFFIIYFQILDDWHT